MIAHDVQFARQVPDRCVDLVVRGQGQIHVCLKSLFQPIALTLHSFSYERCWCLAQLIPTVCRLKQSFQIIDMTLESNVKVTYTLNLFTTCDANSYNF